MIYKNNFNKRLKNVPVQLNAYLELLRKEKTETEITETEITVENIFGELNRQFKYDDSKMKNWIGEKTYRKIINMTQKYREILNDKSYLDTYIDTVYSNLILQIKNENGRYENLYNAINCFVNSFKPEYDSLPYTMDEEMFEDNMSIYNMLDREIIKYIKSWWNMANELYDTEKLKVFSEKLFLEDILTRNREACKSFSKEFKEFDIKFWNIFLCKNSSEKALMRKEAILKWCDFLRKEILSNMEVWKCFLCYDKKVDDDFNKDIVRIIQRDKCVGVDVIDKKCVEYCGDTYRGLSLQGESDDIFRNMYARTIFWRCLKYINEILCKDKYNIPNRFRQNKVEIDIIEIINEIISSKGNQHEFSQTYAYLVRKLFTQVIDFQDRMDGVNCMMAGLLYEVRYDIESNIRKKKANTLKPDIKIVNDKNHTWVYDIKSGNIIRDLSEEWTCAADSTIEEIKQKYLENKIYGELDPVYQQRLIFDASITSTLNGGGNVRVFSARFKKIQFLRDGLSEYLSYNIEKKSGLFLSWIIYNATLSLGQIKGEEIKDLVLGITKQLSLIKNADIRLQVTNSVAIVLNVLISIKRIDIQLLLQTFIGELEVQIREFNEKYDIICQVLLNVFSDKAMQGEVSSDRYKILQGIEYKLSREFYDISYEFRRIYKTGDEKIFKNVLYQQRIENLLNGKSNEQQHKWFSPIFEAIERI